MTPITDQKPRRVIFRIVDRVIDDRRDPYTLLDDSDVSVLIGFSPRNLADYALENGAHEVRHDYDLVKASQR